MTNPHPIDVEKVLADQLATASLDLLRGLLSTFIQALMSADGPRWSEEQLLALPPVLPMMGSVPAGRGP